ncbi:hypothetical protein A2856_03520 [Candidatus Uhrbacteria bacterium RIFCSPHIGHO2_01_FULL_63_20]|uniref:RecF/RecN/SMC N-terminal domain-containing protein n=1 Tax=Candidatus Uhrbacteria bacterium RIFCSPHIGHO2_01_FULL_63_20 TaxID=1802385 RepID=A0A1F7TJV9_9BACT|nr:MAG: hypothetical protein A2856_03520 [Candidatus Uhrbacteria bacterium RIFCSPHIGHO2_01_FULL_63_20]
MHLTELTLQGFKTFAVKTTLRFLSPSNGRFPVTCVVGPNGSGKSNVADAIRWVLGEQSLKLLRGKKGEDVIFSGSQGRGRSGFAEVSLTLDNHDRAMPIDYAEVAITRRLYRDGESEYLLNDAPARLSDIQLLLAQSGVGTRSYSVIGQGMIDHILVSSPEERKAFFDDATGVRPLQIKRHEAMLKLKRTYENLSEVGMLLGEIEPRLKSLKRQVSRLTQREEVERELRELERGYFGTLWWKTEDQLTDTKKKHAALDADVAAAKAGMKELEKRVEEIEKEERAASGPDDGLVALQKRYHDLQKRRQKVRDESFETQKQMELAKVRAQSSWSPLPLSKIISELDGLVEDQKGVLKKVKLVKDLDELKALEKDVDNALDRSTKLVGRLQRPAPEDVKPDPGLMRKLFELDEDLKTIEGELSAVEKEMETSAKSEKRVRTELIDLQREFRAKQTQVHLIENQRNALSIELARLEERRANLAREMDEAMKEQAAPVRAQRPVKTDTEAAYPEIQRLRYKLELIGGIDPEIVKEYEDTKARFEFLDGQVADLKGAVESTEKIIDELDAQIRDQSEKAFKAINAEFQNYFKVLFGGGSCALVKLTREDIKKDEEVEGVTPDRVSQDTVAAERLEHEEDARPDIREKLKEREDRVVGVDIQATPPGKKLKALNLLSGGERALTSIALVCAIMSVNPAPFVLLDEVDAALDEANTFRFASILETLSKLSQFIVITHNRATMERADVLYGVTMGDDGVSNLISVKLEEVKESGTARR